MRLFIAIDIPETIRRDVGGLGRSLASSRPVPDDQLHLTLKFIGEVEGGRVLDIEEKLQEISRPPFSLCLKGVGVFPPRGVPRILWAGVDPHEHIVALRNTIERTLAEVDIPREKQKFSPHLTLARLRDCPLRRLQEFLAGNALLRTPDFPVDKFHLYRSQLTKSGAIHTILQSYPLQNGAA
jgi:2'-5' RNA ligase